MRVAPKASCTRLEADREIGQLPIVEEAAYSGHAPTTNEVGPLQYAVQRSVRRPCAVCRLLAAPGRPKVEIRIHSFILALPS